MQNGVAPVGAAKILKQLDVAFTDLGAARRAFSDLVVKEKFDVFPTKRARQIADDIFDLFLAKILTWTLFQNHVFA